MPSGCTYNPKTGYFMTKQRSPRKITEVELRTQPSRSRPRTRKKSEAKDQVRSQEFALVGLFLGLETTSKNFRLNNIKRS